MVYLFASIACAVGITIGISVVGITIALVLLTAAVTCLAAIMIRSHILRLSLILFSIGLVFIARSASLKPDMQQAQSYSKQAYSFSGVIINNPQTQKGTLSIIVDHVMVNGNNHHWQGKIQASVAPYSDVQYGDQVQLTGKLQLVNPNDPDSYQKYLYYHQIYGTLYRPNLSLVARGQGDPFLLAIYQFQKSLQESIIRILPKDEAGLLLGIVLGLQQPLSKDFSQALNNTSTTHIIVASGYNATIVIGIFLSLAGKLKRRTAIGLALAALAVYVALSGFNPSMIRAAIMAVIALSAQAMGRQRDALRLLALTAIAMLIINPWWILDVSFELSFAATMGIILIEKYISSYLGHLPANIREIASTTIAAQAFTLPIISFNFGNIAMLGMIANILVLWLVPWIMAAGAAVVLLTWTFPFTGLICALFIEPLLWYVKQAIIWSANLPLASLQIQMSGVAVSCYYLLMIIIVWWRGRYVLAN